MTDEALPVQLVSTDPELSIGALLKRYEISKPTLYSYFAALSITQTRLGRYSYITMEEREKVDMLVSYLTKKKNYPVSEAIREMRAGGVYVKKTVEELAREGDSEPQTRSMMPRKTPSDLDAGEEVDQLVKGREGSQGIAAMIDHFWEAGMEKVGPLIKNLLLSPPPADPLRYHRMLREAAEEEWLVTTSMIAEMLEIGRGAIGGEEFERLGYVFKKVGKSGREALWSVTKRERKG